jgi:putative endonuclease
VTPYNYKSTGTGEVSEWLKEHAWKACVGETLPWVRIPPSPPSYAKASDGRPSPDTFTRTVVTRMWYVYILKSDADGELYVGSTNNLRRRLREHGDGECTSTKHRRPFQLEAYIGVQEESTARELEKYLKTGSGIATLRKRILSSEVQRT